MSARNFVWLSTQGGAWSLASNWADTTDGTSPSLVAPGAQDSVTVGGPSGAQMQTITGSASVAAALFTGNTMLSGSFSAGALTLGGASAGGVLQLGRGTALQAASAAIASGSMVAGPGSTVAVSGTMSLGTGGGAAALDATGGGAACVLAMLMTSAADSIYVDPTSILEVGSASGVASAADAAGCLTIDAGGLLSGQGSADAFGKVVNNGTLAAAGGTLSVGALSGTGTLQIGAGATLALNGTCGAGQSVAFAGNTATLALNEEAFAPAGTISGFSAGDAIDVRGSTISAASYAGGVLTLSYAGQVAAQVQLAGSYAGCVFLTTSDGAGGTLVTVAQGAGAAGGPSPGTTSPDQYAWIGAGSGAWNRAGNWQDLTTGATPAAVAPGAADLVTVAASQGVFSVLSGAANAASLTVLGEVALSGAYTFGTLTVGQAAGTSFTNGTLDQLAATTISAASASVADGAVAVAGGTSTLTVAGTLTLGGGPAGVGLPTASLTATAGGSVQTGALVMGGGSGASLATDPTGSIEIGTAGNAQDGAVTVDAGATLTGNGTVNPLGSIVDNGTILAAGGTLSLGAVSGTGSLVISAGATLELYAATAAPIVLQGGASSGSTLALTAARAAPTGTLTGFGLGDVIHLEGSSLTSVQYQSAGAGGTLLLIYGSTIVARIAFAGGVGSLHFIMTPDGTDGTNISVDQLTGGGGTGGQTGTDQLAWTSPVSGSWDRGPNWTDLTTGKAATQPPAAQTPVLVTGPGGYTFQSIAGPGTCASATFLGNTALNGVFTAGQLVVGEAATQGSSALAGAVDVNGAGTLTAAQGVLTDGQILCISAGGLLSITGTLSLGGTPAGAGQPDTLLDIGGHAGGQLGGLSLGGGESNTVTVDSTAWLEVGTAGGAATGALTVDAGSLVSGNGTLNAYGPVVDNGTILAQGGTLLVGGVSGGGSLAIGTEATLALGGTAGCAIGFSGAGATLLLAASSALPTGVISGLAIGDSIVAASPVDTLSFSPGAGGIGTLSMWAGGTAVGQLLLAGNFAGDSFSAQTDGTGAAIVLSTQVFTGPPPGTVTPDSYVWTGGAGSPAWNAAANWTDMTAGGGTAFQPPGQNDAVAIAGGNGSALTVMGPADAAALSMTGTVALAGAYAIGTLLVGTQGGALLAIGSGSSLSAASASVAGGLAVGGGTLSVASMLALGAGGLLSVSGQGSVQAGTLTLGGAGCTVATDAASSVEIGGDAGAEAGSITVDAGGVLQGAGLVSGQVVDQGSIVASGGTLVLGAVSGSGTLLTGAGADLVLQGAVGAGLTADFAGAGTLDLTGAGGAPAIADFGTGDSILLPVSGAAYAAYAITGPGAGLLSIFDQNGQVLTQLTLLGSQSGRIFSVAQNAGGTVLTTQPDGSGTGGTTMAYYPPLTSGPLQYGELLNDVASGFPYVPQNAVQLVTGGRTTYLDFSTDGLASAPYFGGAEGPGANVEIVAPLDGQSGSGVGPDSLIAMQPGYSAVLLEGSEPLALTDWDGLSDTPAGSALLAGNYGNDTIVASGDGDTLVGATGANTVFYAHLQDANSHSSLPVDVYIQGGGNDTIATTQDNADVTTSGGSSEVFLGPNDNMVVSNGSDTIVCAGLNGSDTIYAQASGAVGDLVFASGQGILNFIGGNAPDTVVGEGMELSIQGSRGNGSVVFAGDSSLNYTGSSGSAVIIGGGDRTLTSVQGGSGPVTVFGGTGTGIFSGGAGSVFVVGAGASTVTAGAGSAVYAVGAGSVTVVSNPGAVVYGGSSTGNDVFQATSGPEVLWGGSGTDLFLAGTGPDVMISGGGRDVFSLANNGFTGTDVIYGFQAAQDKIALPGFGSQLPQITTAFGDSIVHLQNGAQIVVANVTNLTGANFTLT